MVSDKVGYVNYDIRCNPLRVMGLCMMRPCACITKGGGWSALTRRAPEPTLTRFHNPVNPGYLSGIDGLVLVAGRRSGMTGPFPQAPGPSHTFAPVAATGARDDGRG